MFRDAINSSIHHNHHLVNDSTLHVVTIVSNPVRFHSRFRIFREFAEKMAATKDVKLYIVELALGDRHHEVTEFGNPCHLQLRSNAELWHKENMINLAVRHLLPSNWRYLAWVDADVFFRNDNWAIETIHKLQHYPVVQPWSECVDLGPYGNGKGLQSSFCGIVRNGAEPRPERHGTFKNGHTPGDYRHGHCGYAWACTREFWENVHGLVDFAILGSADHHMAWAMLGLVDWSIHQKMTDSFKRRLRDWERNAFRMTHGHVACVQGLIEHRFHGSKKKRYYRERWDILIKHKYCPDRDLHYDAQGVLRITGKPHLEDEIRMYMISRQEDSIDDE